MGKVVYKPIGEAERLIAPVVEKKVNVKSFKEFLDTTKKMDYFFYSTPADININDFFNESDSSEVVSMRHTFAYSEFTTAPNLDTHNVENMLSMFSTCRNLITVPLYDTSHLLEADYMFDDCSSLEVIPALDFSNVYYLGNAFYGCTSLTEIHAYGMKTRFNISASTRFSRSALVEILNNLASVITTQTLTMGATNLLKLTEEDIAIATNKNWTLA